MHAGVASALAAAGGAFAVPAVTGAPGAATRESAIRVSADRILVERPESLIGANIEDLNFQLYGGMYSQLLHGECFEEHVDPTELLGLQGPDRFAVWVLLDATGQPVLRYFPGRCLTPFAPTGELGAEQPPAAKQKKAPPVVAGLRFEREVLRVADLPGDCGRRLVALATGDAQVSRHWRRVQAGSARGSLTLVRQGVFTGQQAQEIAFAAGEGELGIDNAGLFREGINLVAGRPYEGILRLRSAHAQTVYVSLRSADGRILAEQPLALAAAGEAYQRLTFQLTPSAADPRGRFALTLRRPGVLTVDYAFLQAGEWGRYRGLPVRREFAEAILAMGVRTMRYNGSMVNRNPDGAANYKWKRMIGPRDERQPYHGFFNPYASHGFSVFEFMDFCEAAGVMPLLGLRIDETEADIADFVAYCLGGPDTPWGRRRIADGHPQPYHLRALQIGNEQAAGAEYLARFKALAGAVWAKNPQLIVLASVNVGNLTADHPALPKAKRQNAQGGLEVMIEMARWVRAQGREREFVLDSHYGSTLAHAEAGLTDSIGLRLHERIAQVLPGFSLRLWPMEENGDRCTWARGLAHAHNLNTLQRLPACLERAGTANTFQAWNLALIWDQGRIHFTPSQFVHQSSYHVDRMYADEWLPIVVPAEGGDGGLDVLAKRSRDGRVLAIYLVNLATEARRVALSIAGFAPREATVTRLGGVALEARNAPDHPSLVAPQMVPWTWKASAPQLELPPLSFTSVRLTR